MCGDLPCEQSSFERYHSFLCVELFFSWLLYDAERGGGGGGGSKTPWRVDSHRKVT